MRHKPRPPPVLTTDVTDAYLLPHSRASVTRKDLVNSRRAKHVNHFVSTNQHWTWPRCLHVWLEMQATTSGSRRICRGSEAS